MSVISDTKLYNQLTGKLGNETAENLVTFIDNKIDQKLESRISIVENKMDNLGRNLESKIDNLAIKLENLANNVEKNMATKADLAETKSELMKWMFIFWVGQAAVTFGFILLYIKK